MSKFTKGQNVKFFRNADVTSASTPVIAVVDKPKATTDNYIQSYIIEHVKGWNPNDQYVLLFSLDKNKKYLFASEEELTAI